MRKVISIVNQKGGCSKTTNFMHIQYVISSMKKNTTEIKNIKKYLLAALYNAPATMQGYYQAEVNYAMPQYAKRN